MSKNYNFLLSGLGTRMGLDLEKIKKLIKMLNQFRDEPKINSPEEHDPIPSIHFMNEFYIRNAIRDCCRMSEF